MAAPGVRSSNILSEGIFICCMTLCHFTHKCHRLQHPSCCNAPQARHEKGDYLGFLWWVVKHISCKGVQKTLAVNCLVDLCAEQEPVTSLPFLKCVAGKRQHLHVGLTSVLPHTRIVCPPFNISYPLHFAAADNKWYRAIVKARDSQGSAFTIQYLDYANSEQRASQQLLPMTTKLLEPPVMALCCCLAGRWRITIPVAEAG